MSNRTKSSKNINSDSNNTAGFQQRQNGLLSWEDTKAVFTGGDNGMTLEEQQLTIAMSMLFLMLIVSAIVNFIVFPDNIMFCCVTAIPPFAIIAIFMFNGLVFHEKIGQISKYEIMFFFTFHVVAIFFLMGGLNGVSGPWIVFALSMTSLILRGLPRQNMLLFETGVFIIAYHLERRYPQYIVVRSEEAMRIVSIASVIEVGFFVAIVIVLQSRIAMFANNKNMALSQELSCANEELTAQNEEILATNENLINLTDRLNEALTSQKLFTASMNHELRAPLNGVLGCMQMLKGADNLTRAQVEVLNAASHSANALVHIVNDLLDYAKIEAGEFQIIEGDFDLKEIVDETPMLFANMIREKGIKLNTEIDDKTPCLLYGDSARIQQIVTNLISNAVKYTHAGEVFYRIKVEDSILKFEVEDTGEGISDDAMEVLFTPFKRLNEGEHKKIQGTGLGLYVTYNLTKKMGGTIEVQSELGKGTKFTVQIPIRVVDANVTYDSKRDDGERLLEVDYSGLKLLCVDDSRVNLMVFEKVVGRATGAYIKVVDSGVNALALLEKEQFDIIFLDHQMPDMDGIETFNRIRQMGIKCPIVALTADAGVEKEIYFREKGFDGFVAKPMKAEAVMETIVRLTNQIL